MAKKYPVSSDELNQRIMHSQIIINHGTKAFSKTNPRDMAVRNTADQNEKTTKKISEDVEKWLPLPAIKEIYEEEREKAKNTPIPTPRFSQEELDRGATKIENATSSIGLGKDVSSKLKDCIPCGLRPLNFDGQLSLEGSFKKNFWENALGDLGLSKINCENLLNGNALQQDICLIIDSLKDLCIPDLMAILSILGLLQAKLSFSFELDMGKLITSLLSTLLGGLLMDLNNTLEDYSKIIVDPITCILTSLENQMQKLDMTEGIRRARKVKERYNKDKMSMLNSRLIDLNSGIRELENKKAQKLSIQEKTKIDKGIDELKLLREKTKNRKAFLKADPMASAYNGSSLKKVNTSIQDTKAALHATNQELTDITKGLTSTLEVISKHVRKGEEIVKRTILTYQEEIMRTWSFSLHGQNELFSVGAQLEELIMLVGLVKSIIKLMKGSEKMCSTKEVMNEYAKESNLVFLKAKIITTDEYGDPTSTDTYIVSPPNTTLIASTIAENDEGDLNEEVVRYNQNDEVRQANNNGVIPSIGNLSATDFKLSYNNGIDGDIDSKYVKILPQSFCKDCQDLATQNLQQWARSL